MIRGRGELEIVKGIVPEYELSAERYFGVENGRAWIEQISPRYPRDGAAHADARPGRGCSTTPNDPSRAEPPELSMDTLHNQPPNTQPSPRRSPNKVPSSPSPPGSTSPGDRSRSSCPIHRLPTLLAGSERYTPRGMGNLGQMNPSEDECVAVPDPSSMRVLSWDPRVVFFNADLLYGGTEPFANCPRSILKSVTQRAASLGFRLMLGVETEFYVFRRDGLPDLVPIAPSSSLFPTPAYDVESTLDSLDFLAEVARHLAAADFGLFSFDHEGGNGQYELDCAHAEALELCDRLVYLRLLLRHVAGRQGCFVTFMPKPMRTCGAPART